MTITSVADLPIWVVILVSGLMVIGSALTLLGAIGLLRLPTFYERIHARRSGRAGVSGNHAGLDHLLLDRRSRAVLHEILIGIFVTLTTPITLILLARAALHRDRSEGDHLFLRRFCKGDP